MFSIFPRRGALAVCCLLAMAATSPSSTADALSIRIPKAKFRIHTRTSCTSRPIFMPRVSTRSSILPATTHHAHYHCGTTTSLHTAASGAISISDGELDPNQEISAEEIVEEKGSVPSAIFNLIKAVVGSGVLALPSGLAAINDSPKSILPATLAMIVLGSFSAYTFGLYGRLADKSQAKSLSKIWEEEKGSSSSWLISLGSMTFCFGASLAYSIMLADTFQSLAMAGGLSGIMVQRSTWIVLINLTMLYPLCSLKSLSSLAPVSVVGVFGILFTAAFIAWRCPLVNPASPYALKAATKGGKSFLSSLAHHQVPLFNTYSKGFFHPTIMGLMGMVASSFMGHFSAPEFYHSVKSITLRNNAMDESVQDGTKNPVTALWNYFKVTIGAYVSVAIINCSILAFGFLTFGGRSNGIVLNNYSHLDPWASVCRILMAACVVGGFPFCISACRGEVVELYHRMTGRKKDPAKARSLDMTITRSLLLLVAAATFVMRNAGFVVGFNGSVMGSCIVYIFPSLLFLANTEKAPLTTNIRLERWFCRFLALFGVFIGVSGGAASVLQNYFPHML